MKKHKILVFKEKKITKNGYIAIVKTAILLQK